MDISDVELYFSARHLAKRDYLLYWTFKLCCAQISQPLFLRSICSPQQGCSCPTVAEDESVGKSQCMAQPSAPTRWLCPLVCGHLKTDPVFQTMEIQILCRWYHLRRSNHSQSNLLSRDPCLQRAGNNDSQCISKSSGFGKKNPLSEEILEFHLQEKWRQPEVDTSYHKRTVKSLHKGNQNCLKCICSLLLIVSPMLQIKQLQTSGGFQAHGLPSFF